MGSEASDSNSGLSPEYLEAVARLVGRTGESEPLDLEAFRHDEFPEAPVVEHAAIIQQVAAYWSESRDGWLVTWRYDRQARTYEMQTNSDPAVTHRWSSVWCGRDEGAWVVSYGTKAECWVRLRALYPQGYGPWSDPILLKPGEGIMDKAA